ncbi:hypothetical protein LCGC14_0690090 [marine sediment metagenome]|uniref:Uncharacterized protein n=1 Tax=marine sediment metagenome TaxID=412755 RepID=A0A0F9QKQ5_9ZZZZ|nr:hypothetical protein [Candidatus Aminicenantes bacterium]
MAVQEITVGKLEGLVAIPIRNGPEDASQTWERGSILIPDLATGEIQEAGNEPVADIIGIATAAASTTTGTDTLYVPADVSGVVFEGNIGTSISAGDIAAVDLFEDYPMTLTGTEWFVDKTDNTNPSVRVVGFKDAIGTTNGRVYFVFIKDALLMNTT